MMAESGPSPVSCPNGMTVNWDQGKDILSIFVILIPLQGCILTTHAFGMEKTSRQHGYPLSDACRASHLSKTL